LGKQWVSLWAVIQVDETRRKEIAPLPGASLINIVWQQALFTPVKTARVTDAISFIASKNGNHQGFM
jgi:hypothetical protein